MLKNTERRIFSRYYSLQRGDILARLHCSEPQLASCIMCKWELRILWWSIALRKYCVPSCRKRDCNFTNHFLSSWCGRLCVCSIVISELNKTAIARIFLLVLPASVLLLDICACNSLCVRSSQAEDLSGLSDPIVYVECFDQKYNTPVSREGGRRVVEWIV